MTHSGVAIVALRARTVYFSHMTPSAPVSDLTTLIASMASEAMAALVSLQRAAAPDPP